MKKKLIDIIQEHPDKDELISKIIIGVSSSDIHEWLKAKYSSINDKKFILSEKTINTFKDTYLDVYNMINQDIAKSKAAIAQDAEAQLALSVQNNPTYRSKMLELANKEIDIRSMVANLCVAIESRVAQVFDQIQEDPRNINTRVDRLLIDYADALGNILEKYYKFTEVPTSQTINHNVSVQVIDQHINVFHDVIKDILSQMDLETSLYFMEVFSEKMNKLKPPAEKEVMNTDMKLAEVKLLNETISKKLNE